MAAVFWRITWQAALVAAAIWIALWLWQWLAPGTFTTPIEWWLILLLFAVHFIPRAISALIGGLRRKA